MLTKTDNRLKQLKEQFRAFTESQRKPLKTLSQEGLKVLHFAGKEEATTPEGLVRLSNVCLATVQEIKLDFNHRIYTKQLVAELDHLHINPKTITVKDLNQNIVLGWGTPSDYMRHDNSQSYTVIPLAPVLHLQYKILELVMFHRPDRYASVDTKLEHLDVCINHLESFYYSIATADGMDRLALTQINLDIISFSFYMVTDLKAEITTQLYKQQKRMIKKESRGFCTSS